MGQLILLIEHIPSTLSDKFVELMGQLILLVYFTKFY